MVRKRVETTQGNRQWSRDPAQSADGSCQCRTAVQPWSLASVYALERSPSSAVKIVCHDLVLHCIDYEAPWDSLASHFSAGIVTWHGTAL